MEFVNLVAELGGEVEKSREGVQWWSGPLPVFGVAAVGIGIKVRETIFVNHFRAAVRFFSLLGRLPCIEGAASSVGGAASSVAFCLRAFSFLRFTKFCIISGATTVSRTPPVIGPQGGLHSLGQFFACHHYISLCVLVNVTLGIPSARRWRIASNMIKFV